MEKRAVFLFSVLLATLLFSSSVLAIGIGSQPLPPYIIFEPNLELEFVFQANTFTDDVDFFAEGDLAPYVTFENPIDIAEKQRQFTAVIKLPETLEPFGDHHAYIGVADVVKNSKGSIHVQANVRTPIRIIVLYPYKFLTASLVAQNVDINETADFKVHLTNFGKPDIFFTKAVIDIYDRDGNLVKSLNTNSAKLPSRGNTELVAEFDATGIIGGDYRAVATVTYDENETTAETNFRVGEIRMDILNHTTELLTERINPFNVLINSKWSGEVRGVYANITIDGTSIKTPTVDISAWTNATLTGYFDTTGMKKGKYDSTVSVIYGDKETSVEGDVYVVSEPGERPLNTTIILIIVIVVLVLVDIIWLIVKKKRKKEPATETMQQNKEQIQKSQNSEQQ